MGSSGAASNPADSHILVTGANSGLGYRICCRLLDDFLASRPAPTQLTLIFTTRNAQKRSSTLKALEAHISKYNPAGRLRVTLRPEEVELTSILSVRALSKHLIEGGVPKLDAIILNAGVGGFTGLDWPLAVWTAVTDPTQAMTYPTFKKSGIGYVTDRQLAGDPMGETSEPPLGQVFCANVFGHYMLAHWLMPLLRSPAVHRASRIIWVSSIEISASHFNLNDLQALSSSSAYEHTKHLIDLLALTADGQPATAEVVQEFYASQEGVLKSQSLSPLRPRIYVAQPGCCVTSIVPLDYYILNFSWMVALYLARLIGSPWHTVSPYIGANAPVWLALASDHEIDSKQERTGGGNAKWGSSVSRLGKQSIRRTDVDGWGTNGTGLKIEWWGGGWGRRRGATDATEDDVERFVLEGAEAWKGMEKLRKEWEMRITEYERKGKEKMSEKMSTP